MATIHDLIEVTTISANTTYSLVNGNLLGVVDNVTSPQLDDGEFDEGDDIVIGGISYNIDRIQEPSSSGRFVLGDGSQRSFDPGSESNLSVVFLTVSNGGDIRNFIIPNDSIGDMRIEQIRTGSINDVGGSDAAVISQNNNDIEIVCFVRGTRIEVPGGRQVPVESLRAGDRVMTADRGPRELCWTGMHRIDLPMLRARSELRAILIRQGALGGGVPDRDLSVSPQHRILIRSRIARRMFGETEVLVAAKHLLEVPGVDIAPGLGPLEYHHILLDAHEIVTANGAPCETLFLGEQALRAFDAADRAAIRESVARPEAMPPGRMMVNGKLGRKLALRHCKNALPFVQPHPLHAVARAGVVGARV